MDKISFQDFLKIDIRVGTIIEAKENTSLNNPSIILKIDFGKKLGIKKSSAQLNSNYNCINLINKKILAITNFPRKQIGKIESEVLVLGVPDVNNNPILVIPEQQIENGKKLY